ncbi:TfoX/Sxy family protein [Breznakiella homolactica]|uniref:TfoX/Sxy family protein n=1 Tax=Breznakiella homolactica TaxID=2798577 RepID=A0A7T7XK18_9SPIR|nr:TfoX/Sxy family protein [Breznakiella homolactica]QQO07844.1 TfoX/Sxy family protein [Breznakiella homolactica]
MASSKAFADFLMEQFSELDGVSCRAMMGEYVLYYREKVAGGIYDDRLMVKPVPAALALMPEAPREAPYPGAKEMLVVEDVDSRTFLAELLEAMYGELPAPKPKEGKQKET